ncbi:MAG TPA: DUF4317 family protein [Bacillota bacterium]|nr:DUF4317 family protein [Bacillota bacterium]
MNKKTIAQFRRQLKTNNDKMQIKEIFHLYIMKDSTDIYHEESMFFDLMEEEEKDMYMTNFKKVLSGQVDQKLFTLKFQTEQSNDTQLKLHEGLLSSETDTWKEHMRAIVHKILANKPYEEDIVVTFIRGNYLQTMKKQGDNDPTYGHSFILCSMNQTKAPDRELVFDYVEKEFIYKVAVDPIIDLKKPFSGFLFPAIIDAASDVNHILYAAKKAYELDYSFIEDVLQAEEVMTAQEDKAIFEEVVNHVAGDQMDTEMLANVYDEINDRILLNEEEAENENEEEAILTYKDVEHVLQASGVKGVDGKEVADAFERVIDDKMHELKAQNVMPKYHTKSIKIETKLANVIVSPEDLRFVKQVKRDGKLYLMIELEEHTHVEGFEMIPEDK